MGQSGTPDFQKITQRRSDNLFPAVSQVLGVGTTTTPAIGLTYWDGLAIKVKPSSQAGSVAVNWYADAALTQLVDTDSWFISLNVGLNVILPVRANFATIGITNTGGGNMTVATYAAGLDTSPGRITYPVTGNVINVPSRSVGALATVTFFLPWIQPGQAWYLIHEVDAGAHLSFTLFWFNLDGTSTGIISEPETTTASSSKFVGLPPMGIAVSVTNQDGASAHTCDIMVIPVGS